MWCWPRTAHAQRQNRYTIDMEFVGHFHTSSKHWKYNTRCTLLPPTLLHYMCLLCSRPTRYTTCANNAYARMSPFIFVAWQLHMCDVVVSCITSSVNTCTVFGSKLLSRKRLIEFTLHVFTYLSVRPGLRVPQTRRFFFFFWFYQSTYLSYQDGQRWAKPHRQWVLFSSVGLSGENSTKWQKPEKVWTSPQIHLARDWCFSQSRQLHLHSLPSHDQSRFLPHFYFF